jgi:hypothetical protein
MKHRSGLTALLTVGLLLAAPLACAQGVPPGAAIADYQAKLAQYQAARAAYEAEAAAYWDTVAAKRRGRNAKRRDHLPIGLEDYVLTQPPLYQGRPAD